MSDPTDGAGDGKAIALEARTKTGGRLFSPSAARNRDAILAVFLNHMPTTGKILEIGSGTGEHAVHFAASLPFVEWRAGDPDPESRASIATWRAHAKLENLKGPHAIDVMAADWALRAGGDFDGLVSINMIHIAPFAAAKGVIAGAGQILRPGGKLFFYGPFARDGEHISASNAEFDRSLKARNPAWGVRDLDREILPRAHDAGLVLERTVEMPANNLSVIFKKN